MVMDGRLLGLPNSLVRLRGWWLPTQPEVDHVQSEDRDENGGDPPFELVPGLGPFRHVILSELFAPLPRPTLRQCCLLALANPPKRFSGWPLHPLALAHQWAPRSH
jgi:hypothetical protein